MSTRQSQITSLFVVCAAQLGLALAMPTLYNTFFSLPGLLGLFAACFMLGIAISHPLLLAVWATLPAAPPRVRVPAALYAGAIELYGFILLYKYGAEADMSYGPLLVSAFVAALLLALPCALLRWKFGWQILSPHPLWQGDLQHTRQFTLRDLFLWTTGIALFIGLGVAMLEPGDFFPDDADSGDKISMLFYWLVCAAVAALLALPGLALLGVLFQPARAIRWLGVAAGGAVATTLALALLLTALQGFRPPGAPLFDLALVSIYWKAILIGEFALLASNFSSLLILWLGGWRFAPGPVPPAPSETAAPAPSAESPAASPAESDRD